MERVVRICRLYFCLPVSREIVGQSCRCDFCERPLAPVAGRQVALGEWSPPEGLAALVDRLVPGDRIDVTNRPSEERLHSLLSAVQEASSWKNVDVMPGAIAGIILGIAAGVPIGLLLFDHGLAPQNGNRFGFVFLCVLSSVVIGVVAGSTLGAILGRGRVAFRKIDRACRDYRLDIRRLEDLAEPYGEVIGRAIRQVRDSV